MMCYTGRETSSTTNRLRASHGFAEAMKERKKEESGDLASASTRREASCRLAHVARTRSMELATSCAGGLDRACPRATGHLRGQPSRLLSVREDCLHATRRWELSNRTTHPGLYSGP